MHHSMEGSSLTGPDSSGRMEGETGVEDTRRRPCGIMTENELTSGSKLRERDCEELRPTHQDFYVDRTVDALRSRSYRDLRPLPTTHYVSPAIPLPHPQQLTSSALRQDTDNSLPASRLADKRHERRSNASHPYHDQLVVIDMRKHVHPGKFRKAKDQSSTPSDRQKARQRRKEVPMPRTSNTGEHYRQHVYEQLRPDDLQSANVHLRTATNHADPHRALLPAYPTTAPNSSSIPATEPINGNNLQSLAPLWKTGAVMVPHPPCRYCNPDLCLHHSAINTSTPYGPFHELLTLARLNLEGLHCEEPSPIGTTTLDAAFHPVSTIENARVVQVVNLYIEARHLDMLHGFDCAVPQTYMIASLVALRLRGPASNIKPSEESPPSDSQLAACLIVLDIIDMFLGFQDGAYSGLFLQDAIECLRRAARCTESKSNTTFLYAL
ncbi:hypothetical protein SISNIDRAFT_279429 [Sistotremastrum niveocremeum HHB9708]|uniref:Uncharacterized protein n=1 Tax=Sistotremastrum niveocremeum HHB9708 TaxID=1314777 RepID=A0A164NQL4_9AGAM|nr:hypothetical protein SISNIDRAFT_279429 [Sistotremastrum niveocremeum HHB9708]